MRYFISIVIITIFLGGCSFGESKDNPYIGWTPKQFWVEANKKADNGENKEAIDLFEKLQANFPNSKYSHQAKLQIPFTLYKSEKYDEAIDSLNEYIKLFPKHSSVPYAYYLRGVISQNKSKSLLDDYNITDNANRDINSVKDAFNYYFELIEKFPNSKYSVKAKTQLVKLKNILARHELIIAIFYTKRPAAISAVNRCKYIIEHYPNSPSIPAALHLMAYNYTKLGQSVLAADTLRVLQDSYPKYTPHYSLK